MEKGKPARNFKPVLVEGKTYPVFYNGRRVLILHTGDNGSESGRQKDLKNILKISTSQNGSGCIISMKQRGQAPTKTSLFSCAFFCRPDS